MLESESLVTHNPEILTEADLVVTLRDGQVTDMRDRMIRKTQEVTT